MEDFGKAICVLKSNSGRLYLIWLTSEPKESRGKCLDSKLNFYYVLECYFRVTKISTNQSTVLTLALVVGNSKIFYEFCTKISNIMLIVQSFIFYWLWTLLKNRDLEDCTYWVVVVPQSLPVPNLLASFRMSMHSSLIHMCERVCD